MSDRLTFYYAPYSRAGGTMALLEELGVDYDLKVLNLSKQESRDASYLAVNPMGKVPAIVHRGELVSEQPAVYIYLADEFSEKGLAPAIGDPLRGPYLRWMVFYGSCFEPALTDMSMQREPAPPSRCPYGDTETMFRTLIDQVSKGPYLLGERFTAADVLWGQALAWTVSFKLVPETPEIRAYIDRVISRPAIARAREKDAAFAAAQAA
ncbi:glutathione S-transferase [Dyella terrae]|uniref:Glutathione S-transferase n=3 Tax=Rhodanobacteraceae TaxID=1775411 RepID=A0A4R0YRV5_9GAMM|nr:glutathione S-transferase [Dyella terrae]TCI08613.1 glutathione S-transferase [Dyella soli]